MRSVSVTGCAGCPRLAELVVDADLEYRIGKYVDAERIDRTRPGKLAIARPTVSTRLPGSVHTTSAMIYPPTSRLRMRLLSVPVFCLRNRHRRVAKQGLDTTAIPPTSVVGHSLVGAGHRGDRQRRCRRARCAAGPAIVGSRRGTIVARRRGLAATSDGTPMMADRQRHFERVDAILATIARASGP